MTADRIFKQSIDKQRVVVTGNGSRFITLFVVHVLKHYNRKFDYVIEGQKAEISKDSPTIIIQAATQLTDYKHHIAMLTDLAAGADATVVEQFANATPKGGTLIYQEGDSKIKTIGDKERPDIQSIPFKIYQHEVKDGKTILISSTKERVPVRFSGSLQLQYVSAAKEVLKKLGITSSQFYGAVGSFDIN